MGQQLELFPVKKFEVVQLKLFPEYEQEIDNSRKNIERLKSFWKKHREYVESSKQQLIAKFIKEYNDIDQGYKYDN